MAPTYVSWEKAKDVNTNNQPPHHELVSSAVDQIRVRHADVLVPGFPDLDISGARVQEDIRLVSSDGPSRNCQTE